MELTYLYKLYNKYTNKFIKSSYIMKFTTLFILIIIIPYYSYITIYPDVEGFNNNKTTYDNLKTLSGKNIYDKFYASIYDDLLYCETKNKYEVDEILKVTKLDKNTSVLDIGSGTGHHVSLFSNRDIESRGLDLSPAMVNKAKDNYPNENYQVGNALNGSLFMPNKFTLITCLYFTIYYFKDKRQFFQNCIHWLQPGGHIAIHLVDKYNFDPILPPANPLIIISPQKYADKRITNSFIQFDTHDYSSDFKLEKNSNMAIMYETFKNKKNGKIRKHEHNLYFDTQMAILSQAEKVGFEFITKINMAKCQYDNQFIYILRKPS